MENRSLHGCGEIGTLCAIAAGNVRWYTNSSKQDGGSQKIKFRITVWFSHSVTRNIFKGIESRVLNRYLYANVDSWVISSKKSKV